MTAQCTDIWIVDEASISLSSMGLYGVRIGEIDELRKSSEYVFASSADETKMTGCTALWRGYVSTYRRGASESKTYGLRSRSTLFTPVKLLTSQQSSQGR